MSELSWDERNKRRELFTTVLNDMVADQLPRQFFGVDGNCFKLDEQVFEAIEDESDGYRSSMDYVEQRDPQGLIFFKTPVDTVRLEKAPDKMSDHDWTRFSGWVLRSVTDGHVWLWFGTDDYNDYYPCFTFRYCPRTA